MSFERSLNVDAFNRLPFLIFLSEEERKRCFPPMASAACELEGTAFPNGTASRHV